MTDTADLLAVADGARVFDLARPYRQGMAQSPNHPPFRHALDRRHGDRVRADGGSAAADIIVMGCHVGTHVDALAHVSHDGLLHGGIDAAEAQQGGRFDELGIEAMEPVVGRGVLLDVPGALGVERLDGGHEIGVDELERTVEAQDIPLGAGDVVLVRSGWGQLWDDPDAYIGADSGVPGVGEAGAEWLAGHEPTAVGADTIAFECLAPGAGHALLPAHRVLLVEHGINIVETLDLEALAAAAAHEFLLVLAPLPIVGATGAPVRPIAIAAP
ncbi:MAG: cyclase family protein [Actinomycetota bacterium]